MMTTLVCAFESVCVDDLGLDLGTLLRAFLDDELIVAVEDLQSLPKTEVDPELEASWRDLAKKRWGMAVDTR